MARIGDGFSTSKMPSFSGVPKKLKLPPVGLYGSTAGVRLTDQSSQPMRPQPIYGNDAGMSFDQTKLAPNWSMPQAGRAQNATASKPQMFNTQSSDGYDRIENIRSSYGRGAPTDYIQPEQAPQKRQGGLRGGMAQGMTAGAGIGAEVGSGILRQRLAQEIGMPKYTGGYDRIENMRSAGRGAPVENFDISRETVGGLRKEPLISGATNYMDMKPIDFIDLRKRRLMQQGPSMPQYSGGASYSAPEPDAPVNTGTRWVR